MKVGSDFSGIGAFNQALNRLGIPHKHVFACDMDEYARQSYLANYEAPDYFPENVYEREIPKEPLDIYMTSPPCQAFSLAGKRKGEKDKRGVLFYNSHEFIKKNKPRYFIFENVKGLLSADSGKIVGRWIELLGGVSVNGNPVMFPHVESVPYHIYYKVLNAKHYGVPQNRERVFIVGIRSDQDNHFNWPKPFPLEKRLKDVLETDVDEKYFLSDKMLNYLNNTNEKHKILGNGFEFKPRNPEGIATCITARVFKQGCDDNYIDETPEHKIAAIRGRNPENPNDRTTGAPTQQRLEINENGTSNALTTVQKDNVVVYPYRIRRLTPRECFRLMDFPEDFKIVVSDTQAYKQAGNSIVVNVLYLIIKNLKLKYYESTKTLQ